MGELGSGLMGEQGAESIYAHLMKRFYMFFVVFVVFVPMCSCICLQVTFQVSETGCSST